MSLNIPPEFERAVLERVRSGQYESPEEVLRACLGALEREEESESSHLDALRHEIELGIRSAEEEELISAADVKELIRARLHGGVH
jgi:putative addiction module CopG family antidote